VIGQGLRQLQEALNRKAGAVQQEFIAVGEKLQALSRKIAEARGADPAPLIAEQEALREKQRTLAEEVNLWRERARGALRQQGDEALRAYLGELQAAGDEAVSAAVEQVRHLLDASEEELARLAQSRTQAKSTTPAGRLIERARTEYDLRGQDPAPRQKAAVEFANRAGMAQDDEALAELEGAVGDADPLVDEVATLTLIQVHRFRAMRLGDLDAVHNSVQRLASVHHPAVIPILIEIVETPRTGFRQGAGGMVEGNNSRSREAALTRLVEWHTPEAQAAVRARQRDRDARSAQDATRALDFYSGEWK
jgi:hypothetical protein